MCPFDPFASDLTDFVARNSEATSVEELERLKRDIADSLNQYERIAQIVEAFSSDVIDMAEHIRTLENKIEGLRGESDRLKQQMPIGFGTTRRFSRNRSEPNPQKLQRKIGQLRQENARLTELVEQKKAKIESLYLLIGKS